VEGEAGDLEKVLTPDCATIADLAEFLGVPQAGTRKALAIVTGEGKPAVVFVPGDHEMNDVKAEHAFGEYHLMTDEEIEYYGLVKGFMGPVGLPEGVAAYADESLRESQWWTIGANERDYHLVHAQPGRDFEIADGHWVDVVTAQEGDACPKCGRPLHGARGIEVSQVFQLGTKYSEAMGATFMDDDGKEKPFQMGCYGIGVSRTLQAVVEQHHDDQGIVWPVCVAPYEVEVVPLDVKGEVWDVAQQVARALVDAGVEVVVDDRKERAGVKFADADLMGFPYQIVLGKRGVKNGVAEVKVRATGEREEVALDTVATWLAEKILPLRA
jgi:prolyl-tRNA synthetase